MTMNVPDRTTGTALPRTAGGFELLDELGRGGMGIVYRARETASGRLVALKILASELRLSDEAFERFRREARLAAAISDRHCVFVYGAHEVEGAPAIAMELCLGETLDQKLARNERIPIETAVRWTLEILEGLEAAHRSGVVHRDVKPSNCFTTADGHVKVGDFGLSRSLDSDIHLTQSGAFIGSPLYASPEQIRGREVDLRSDLYSCGATLYALLTGKAPYSGSNIGEVLARILSESPPQPHVLRPEIPRELEKIVLRAMDRDPKRRFQDHASFRSALQPFAAGALAPATRMRRFAAYVVDTAAMSVVSTTPMAFASWLGLDFAALDVDRPWRMRSLFFALVLQAAVPWAWFTLVEGIFGAGPGKWVLGLRVVGVDSHHRSLARCALRACVFFAPTAVVFGLAMASDLGQAAFGIVTGFTPIAFHVAYCITMRRANGWRALHEIASGTRVVQKGSPFARLRRSRPPPSRASTPAAGAPATVGPYRVEGTVGRSVDGRVFAAHDTDLARSVWIHAGTVRGVMVDESRRALAREGRLRWLDSVQGEGVRYEVFESPGGTSLVHWTESSEHIEWPTAQRYLAGLVEELCLSSSELGTGARFTLGQVWIDRAWNARLLDFPVDEHPGEPISALELFNRVAQRTLAAGDMSWRTFPADLPAHAEPVVSRLIGHAAPFERLEDARRALQDLSGRSMELARSTRIAQIFLGSALPLFLFLLSVIGALWILPLLAEVVEGSQCLAELEAHRTNESDAGLTTDQVKSAQLLAVHGFSVSVGRAAKQQLTEPRRKLLDEAVALYPEPNAAEIAWARDVRQRATDAGQVDEGRSLIEQVRAFLPSIPANIVGAWGIVGMLSAVFFRGGVTLSLCGIRVRSRRGPLASRVRCLWRCAVGCVPLFIAYAAGAHLARDGSTAIGLTIIGVTMFLHACGVAFAVWKPTTSLQDRLAGTTLVPR